MNLFREIGWHLGWIYLPERDAVEYILEGPVVEIAEDVTDSTAGATVDRFANLRRFDGVDGAPDFGRFSYAAEHGEWLRQGWKADARLTYTDAGEAVPPVGDSIRRRWYMKVRPHVVEGRTAKEIAHYFSKSEKWAEGYVTAVRSAFRARWENEQGPPPLSEGEGAKSPVIVEL